MFEAFKIGVRISLINHASLGLAALGKDFLKTEEQASLLQKRIDSINKQAVKGGLMLGLGAGIAGMLKGPYEQAKKLEQERQKFETLNLSPESNAAAFAQATTLAHKNLGSTISENIGLIRDLHTAFGDLPHALGMSEDFQKFSIMSRVQNDGKPVEGLVYNAVKALEHRGDRLTQHPDEMKDELRRMSQDYTGSGGKITPNDFFHASQTGKMAYTMYDKDYLYGPFAAYMQAKTGPTAGTAGMTAFSSLIGGHMDDKAKGFLASLGLLQIGVSKEQVKLVNASIEGLDLPAKEKAKLRKAEMPLTGGLTADNATLFAHRPDQFISSVLVPAIRKRYGMDLTNEQIAEMVASKFNRSTGDFIGEHIVNGQKFAKDTVIFNNAKDYESGYQQYIKSPEGAEIAADAAWKNFLAMFGTVYLPVITGGLIKLAGGLDSLAQTVQNHPAMFKALAYALIGLSGALMFRGTVLILTAALRGLGLAMTMQAVGGAAGMGKIVSMIGGASKFSLFGAIGMLANPIGIAVLALGTLVAAAYAFRPLTQSEVDAAKTDGGVKLTPDAQRRIDADGAKLTPDALRRPAAEVTGSPHIATGGNGSTTVHVHATMDGTPIVTNVAKVLVRKLNPSLGTGHFDPRATPLSQYTTGP
jgi:hypothetical protein